MITPEMTLGKIVQLMPDSTRIFRAHRLDFCCGGEQTLQKACEEKKLKPEIILQELSNLKPPELTQDPAALSLAELTQYIVKRFHEDLRQRIPELIRLAGRVERVHCDSSHCPKGLSSFLRFLMEEMENHMQKEEQVLFPMIERGQNLMTTMPIQCMKSEHLEHAKNLERLREITNQFQIPPEACTTWQALYSGLDTLEEEIMKHIYLENHVLFPRCLGQFNH